MINYKVTIEDIESIDEDDDDDELLDDPSTTTSRDQPTPSEHHAAADFSRTSLLGYSMPIDTTSSAFRGTRGQTTTIMNTFDAMFCSLTPRFPPLRFFVKHDSMRCVRRRRR